MTPTCLACLAGPSSIDGHADLTVRTIGSTLLTFQCSRCHTQWARGAQDGIFTWKTIDAQTGRTLAMGAMVPPRSDASKEPTTR
jgi:hypothetical protein